MLFICSFVYVDHLQLLFMDCRLNPCPVTRALYLEVLLHFLEFQDAIAHLQRNTALLSPLSSLTTTSPLLPVGAPLSYEEVYIKEMEVLLFVGIHFPATFKPKAADDVFRNIAQNLNSELVQMYAVKHMKLLREHSNGSLSPEPLVDLLQELALQPCSSPDLLMEVGDVLPGAQTFSFF